MRKYMRQEQVYRCDKLQPGTGIQCGMYADHDDDCTVLIPTGAPWFPGREHDAPDAQPEPATTDDVELAASLDNIALVQYVEGDMETVDARTLREAAQRLRTLAAEKKAAAGLVRAALEFAAAVDGTADQFTAAEDWLNNAAIDFAVDMAGRSVGKHLAAALDDARQGTADASRGADQ